jgi:hypothetical protein
MVTRIPGISSQPVVKTERTARIRDFGLLCALLYRAGEISVLRYRFPFDHQGFQPIGNGNLDVVHSLLFGVSIGSAPGQRGAMRAVPPVFLTHKHGVRVSRHPLPPFSIDEIPRDLVSKMGCMRRAAKAGESRTSKFSTLTDHGPGEQQGGETESIKYSRLLWESGKISGSAKRQSPNFLLRYRKVE